MTDFEFDDNKNRLNKERHGVDFHDAQLLWKVTNVVVEVKSSSAEQRWAMIGMIHEECYLAVFTKRRDHVRLISFHRADRRFVKIYEKYIKEKENP